jgi:hypothetical protein
MRKTIQEKKNSRVVRTMQVVCGKYTLRGWDKGRDWPPRRINVGSFTLECENKQVGAASGSINTLVKIQTDPTDSGHGTVFLKMLMGVAKSAGATRFRAEGVIGDTRGDKEKIEHILRKLGFNQIDDDTWEKNL